MRPGGLWLTPDTMPPGAGAFQGGFTMPDTDQPGSSAPVTPSTGPAPRPEPIPSTHHVPARESGSNDAAQGLGGHSKDVPHEKTGG